MCPQRQLPPIGPSSARILRGFNKACACVGSIVSRYSNLQRANSVQLLVRLQQAILQPCALYGCEIWAPADAAVVPLQGL